MRRTATLVAALALIAEARAEGMYEHLFDPGMLHVDEVIGMEVVTPEGRTLGRIRDLLYDRASGKVESIAVGGIGGSYPVSALLAADTPGKVILEPLLEPSAAGGNTLNAAPLHPLSSASGQALLIDLREGRVRPRQ